MENRELVYLDKFGGTSGLMKALGTSPSGLDPDELDEEHRWSLYGHNELAKPQPKSFFKLWLEAFNDTTLIILLILAVISLVIALAVEKGADMSWLDGTAILVTVLVVTLVSAWNTWSQERQFQSLNDRQKDRDVLVIRGGKPTPISLFQLLVGDILTVSTGDVLPVDGICLESNNISCDEAAMTGESDLIRKNPEKHPFLLSGCKVQTGFGKMLVVAVGMNTQFGILKQAVLTSTQERSLTPLQTKLDAIGIVGFIAAGFVLVLLVVFWIVPGAQHPDSFKTAPYWLLLLDYFTIAVTIIVMAVPEGLPLAVTIALAYSMKKMLKDNNLVRVLSACETMGGATTICSDKTGTLTQNKMKVTDVWFDGFLKSNVQKSTLPSPHIPSSSSSSSSSPANTPPSFTTASSSSSDSAPEVLETTLSIDETQISPKSASTSPRPAGTANTLGLSPPFFSLVTEAISLNSSANLQDDAETGEVKYLGNVTECAMLLFCREQGVDYTAVRAREKLVQTFPFSSERKRMTVVAEKTQKGERGEPFYRVYTKGASEIVSALCTKMHRDEDVVDITESDRTEIENVILKLASRGLRTIALAYRDISAKDAPQAKKEKETSLVTHGAPTSSFSSSYSKQGDSVPNLVTSLQSSLLSTPHTDPLATDSAAPGGKSSPLPSSSSSPSSASEDDEPAGPFGDTPPEEEMILLGITGIKDPLREEVPAAIQDCHDAHIVVRMVTGDNIVTAMHIAQECGIYDPEDGIAMEGPVFRQLSDEDRKRVLPRLQVLARSSPIDKHTLVSGLQDMDHVVAVTGDGTNDAPALSKSDVGFAMGITGTEVAKDASSIIITDDNFASIVKAVMWGRNVYDCIRKFIQFQLTVNVTAIIIAVIGALFAITPLRAVQMLWVNLIMDTLAALALATESPTKQLLKRKPYGKHDSIICKSMWRNIIAASAYEAVVLVVTLFLWGNEDAGAWRDPSDRIRGCGLLLPHDIIECSELMFPHGLCRHFLLDPNVAVFSEQHFSFVFNTFIFMQLFNWISSRKCYNELNFFERIFQNYMFVVIWVIVAALQVVIMLVPGIRDAFSVIPISGQLWGFSIAFALCILPFKFLIHLIKMPDPFNGEIPIVPDPGAPAGVYTLAGTPPPGCTLQLPTPPPTQQPQEQQPEQTGGEEGGARKLPPELVSMPSQPRLISSATLSALTVVAPPPVRRQQSMVDTPTQEMEQEKGWKVIRHVTSTTAIWKKRSLPFLKRQSFIEEKFLPPK